MSHFQRSSNILRFPLPGVEKRRTVMLRDFSIELI